MTDELAPLLNPISSETPSGVDLEYDPDFAEMEKASQGTSDQEFGSTVIEGTPPDWDLVRKQSFSLLKRSKDLRIASYFAQAELELKGLRGFRDALEIIASIVESYWETCFPELDPDDDNDPTIRINALHCFTKPGGIIRQLRNTAIARSRSAGILSLVDYLIARGEMPPPAGMNEPPTLKRVEAIFKTGDPQDLESLREANLECIKLIDRIERSFSDQVGAFESPDLDPLTKELKLIAKAHAQYISSPEPTSQSTEDPSDSNAPNESNTDQDDPINTHVVRVSTAAMPVFDISKLEFKNREEAVLCLAKIIDWFNRFEPSSPLPLLLRRARRLSTMSFMDILRDISPDGINQALLVGGQDSEEEQIEAPKPDLTPESPPKPAQRKTTLNQPTPSDSY